MKLLIIKLSALGDIVHTLPVLTALKQNKKDLVIDWLCYDSFATLLQDLSKNSEFINQIHSFNKGKLSSYLEIVQLLKKQNYDYVFDFQGLFKTAVLSKMISKNNIGHKNPREKLASIFYTHKINSGNLLDNKKHIIEKSLALLEALDIKNPSVNFPYAFHKTKIERFVELKDIAFVPSTTWETKFWPAKYWANFSQALIELDPSKNISLIGSPKDQACFDEILQHCDTKVKNKIQIINNKKLNELAETFAHFDLVLGVDTGPLHIAAAVNDNVLGIYGPTSGKRSGPYGAYYLSYDEIFSRKASHKRTFKEDGYSMSNISPEMLLNKVQELYNCSKVKS